MRFADYAKRLLGLAETVHRWLGALSELEGGGVGSGGIAAGSGGNAGPGRRSAEATSIAGGDCDASALNRDGLRINNAATATPALAVSTSSQRALAVESPSTGRDAPAASSALFARC